MKVGDLIKVPGCDDEPTCPCAFCTTGSNRTGIIMWKAPDYDWVASFDKVGPWEIWEHEAKVINKAR